MQRRRLMLAIVALASSVLSVALLAPRVSTTEADHMQNPPYPEVPNVGQRDTSVQRVLAPDVPLRQRPGVHVWFADGTVETWWIDPDALHVRGTHLSASATWNRADWEADGAPRAAAQVAAEAKHHPAIIRMTPAHSAASMDGHIPGPTPTD